MGTIGIWGFLIIVAVVVLLFGARWLPGWGRSLGQGMQGFTRELTSSLKGEGEEEDRVEASPPAAEAETSAAPPAEKQRVSS